MLLIMSKIPSQGYAIFHYHPQIFINKLNASRKGQGTHRVTGKAEEPWAEQLLSSALTLVSINILCLAIQDLPY